MERDGRPVRRDVHVTRPVDGLVGSRLGQRLAVPKRRVRRRAPRVLDVVAVAAVAVRAEE